MQLNHPILRPPPTPAAPQSCYERFQRCRARHVGRWQCLAHAAARQLDPFEVMITITQGKSRAQQQQCSTSTASPWNQPPDPPAAKLHAYQLVPLACITGAGGLPGCLVAWGAKSSRPEQQQPCTNTIRQFVQEQQWVRCHPPLTPAPQLHPNDKLPRQPLPHHCCRGTAAGPANMMGCSSLCNCSQ